jgi:hypothetical protein
MIFGGRKPVLLLAPFVLVFGSPVGLTQSRAVLVMSVTELGSAHPIAGVTVTISQKGAATKLLTDSDGRARFTNLMSGPARAEWELLGYIRRPEKRGITLRNGDNTADVTLVNSRGSAQYYRDVGKAIQTAATNAESPKDVYLGEWDRLKLLPADARSHAASEMNLGFSYLSSDAEFAKAHASNHKQMDLSPIERPSSKEHAMSGCVQRGTTAETYVVMNSEAKGPKMSGIVESKVNLAPHVGHRITITGVDVPAKEVESAMAKERGIDHYMRVSSIKMVSATCP